MEFRQVKPVTTHHTNIRMPSNNFYILNRRGQTHSGKLCLQRLGLHCKEEQNKQLDALNFSPSLFFFCIEG